MSSFIMAQPLYTFLTGFLPLVSKGPNLPAIHALFKYTNPPGKIFQWLVIPWGRIQWRSLKIQIPGLTSSDGGKALIYILILIYKNTTFNNYNVYMVKKKKVVKNFLTMFNFSGTQLPN